MNSLIWIPLIQRSTGMMKKTVSISRNMTAARVFLDPHKLIREDTEHPEEQRYDVLGKVGKVLFVVCTFRESNTIRLISARLASPAEKARYENGEDYDE